MNLHTTQQVPTTDLLAHIKALYPTAQVGTCNDFGGVADGIGIGTETHVLYLYFDADGSFCEGGWTVEQFDLDTLNPEGYHCVNLEAAIATFAHIVRKCGLRPVHSLTVEEAEAELAEIDRTGERPARWADLRDYLVRMGVEL